MFSVSNTSLLTTVMHALPGFGWYWSRYRERFSLLRTGSLGTVLRAWDTAADCEISLAEKPVSPSRRGIAQDF